VSRISAIETPYKGCRFRSRLEARWAVFLDTADIAWEYEPEGFHIRRPGMERFSWLPDFWLGCGQWAEVKGSLDEAGAWKLLRILEAVTRCGPDGTADVALLGPLPREDSCLWPAQLHTHGQKLWAVPWDTAPGCPLAAGRPRSRVADEAALIRLLDGMPAEMPPWGFDAVMAARGARFEWGESG